MAVGTTVDSSSGGLQERTSSQRHRVRWSPGTSLPPPEEKSGPVGSRGTDDGENDDDEDSTRMKNNCRLPTTPLSSFHGGNLLHGTLRQRRGATLSLGGVRSLASWKWRHVVLNIDDGSLSLYRAPMGTTKGDRCQTRVLVRGGRHGTSSREDDLPVDEDLCLRLPRRAWRGRDDVTSEKVMWILYDADADGAYEESTGKRVVKVTGGYLKRMGHMRHGDAKKGNSDYDDNDDGTLRTEILRTSSEETAETSRNSRSSSEKGGSVLSSELGRKESDDDDLDWAENDAADDGNGEGGRVKKVRTITSTSTLSGRLCMKCPGGGNEKATWIKAMDQLGNLVVLGNAAKKKVAGGAVATLTKSSWRYRTEEKATSPLQMSFALRQASKDNLMREESAAVLTNLDDSTAATTPAASARLVGRGVKLRAMGGGAALRLATAKAISNKEAAAASNRKRVKEYAVRPAYAYPNQWMTLRELEAEMMRTSSTFHDLSPMRSEESVRLYPTIGALHVEVLQCLGLPKLDRFSNTDAVAYLVCGECAFCTDVMIDCNSPMWPCKSRRAAIFPLSHAYARLYVGVFDDDGDFAGRVAVDVACLRPNSVYDVALPLRQSVTQMYSRRPRGVVRLRFLLTWGDEKAAVMSYLPRRSNLGPVTIPCGDKRGFRCLALTVHGVDMNGKFSKSIVRATSREVKLYKLHTKALMMQMAVDVSTWDNPVVSTYVFAAWMHCAHRQSVTLAFQYVIGFVIICLLRNYARYNVSSAAHGGFAPLTMGEIFASLLHREGCGGASGCADGGGREMDESAMTGGARGCGGTYHAMKPLEVKRRGMARVGSPSGEGSPPHRQGSIASIVFRSLGFLDNEDAMAGAESGAISVSHADHVEFPFSDRNFYSKMSLKEAMVDHTSSSSLPDGLKSLDPVDDSDGEEEERIEDFDTKESVASKSSRDEDETGEESGGSSHENPAASRGGSGGCGKSPARLLGPQQNIDIPVKTTTILEDLAEFKGIAHSVTGGLFHDGVFKVSNARRIRRLKRPVSSPATAPDTAGSVSGNRGRSKRVNVVSSADGDKGDGGTVEEMKRHLGIGVHRNPVYVMADRYFGPMVQIQRIGLCAFRATFNLFIWKDPYLSFWFLLLCIGLVCFIRIFPWRMFIFALGLGVVGPQNWVIRKLRESGRFNFDLAKMKLPQSPISSEEHNESIASDSHDSTKSDEDASPAGIMEAEGNGTVDEDSDVVVSPPPFEGHKSTTPDLPSILGADLPAILGGGLRTKKRVEESPSVLQEVVVPYSPLRQERFYDWPPEPSLSRVTPSESVTRTILNASQ